LEALLTNLCAFFCTARNHNGKHRVLVVIRARGGNSVPAVFSAESQAGSFIRARIAKGTGCADKAASWDNLHEHFDIKRISDQEAYSLDVPRDMSWLRLRNNTSNTQLNT
jgi:hypothetical protein